MGDGPCARSRVVPRNPRQPDGCPDRLGDPVDKKTILAFVVGLAVGVVGAAKLRALPLVNKLPG